MSQPAKFERFNWRNVRFSLPVLIGLVLACAILFGSIRRFGFSNGSFLFALIILLIMSVHRATSRRVQIEKRDRVYWGVLAAFALVGAIVTVSVHLPDRRERVAWRRAQNQAEHLRKLLAEDIRFQGIVVSVKEGKGYWVSVGGRVGSEEERNDLKGIIDLVMLDNRLGMQVDIDPSLR